MLDAGLGGLADALASSPPALPRAERVRRLLRRARRDVCDQEEQAARHPAMLYAVATRTSHVFVLGGSSAGDGWWTYCLTPLAPGALPPAADVTVDGSLTQMVRRGRFATDDVPLYDGTTAAVDAALLRVGDVPDDLTEWLEEVVGLVDALVAWE